MSERREEVLNELLVLKAQNGDDAALGELVQRWQARLLAHARRLTGDAHGAEEALQESWLAIVRGIRRLQHPEAFGWWVYRIVGRECANWVKTRQRQRHSSNRIVQQPVTTGDVDGLQKALDELTVEHREALVLHYLEGLSVADIAEALGVREGTIKSRLHYAREAMRKAIGE
jgi:RNA polymerase sigma-70 factor (ECF subfamily)